jgi:hypothetical protein
VGKIILPGRQFHASEIIYRQGLGFGEAAVGCVAAARVHTIVLRTATPVAVMVAHARGRSVDGAMMRPFGVSLVFYARALPE